MACSVSLSPDSDARQCSSMAALAWVSVSIALSLSAGRRSGPEISAGAVVVGRGVAWRAVAVARYHVPHKDCPAESDRKTQDDGDDQSGQGTPPSVLRADLPEGNRLKGR